MTTPDWLILAREWSHAGLKLDENLDVVESADRDRRLIKYFARLIGQLVENSLRPIGQYLRVKSTRHLWLLLQVVPASIQTGHCHLKLF